MPINPRHAAEQARATWPPTPGTFKLRLVRGGWMVPAEIQHLDSQWQAIVNGEPMPAVTDPASCPHIGRIWSYALKIPRFEFEYLSAIRDGAKADHPSRNPTVAIDRMLLPPAPIPKRRKS